MVASGEYQDLFKPKAWLDRLSPASREWLDGLVDAIVESGSEPSWASAYERFAKRFPGEEPKSDTTLKTNVRLLVAEKRRAN